MKPECHPALNVPRPYVAPPGLESRIQSLEIIIDALKDLHNCRYDSQIAEAEKKLRILVDALPTKV